MAIPPTAITFAGPMDPQEVLDFEFPMGPVLESGETIASSTLVLLPEAVALGLEIIEDSDPDYPGPVLVEGNTTIRAWFRVDQSFADNPAFQGSGTPLPMLVTLDTTAAPPRRRQRTFLIRLAEL